MKLLTYMLCLFCFCNYASAQDTLHNKVNGNTKVTMGDTTGKSGGLYVIDGKPVNDNEFNKLSHADIFEVAILTDSAATTLYGSPGANGATSIITKSYALKLYQQKLSAFSKKYKDYLDQKGDDSKLLYVINNTMLIARTNKTLRELYDLAPDDIKKVDFKKNSRFVSDATVIITTKE
jgi:hypothetical protein